jgi:hypothetical protein
MAWEYVSILMIHLDGQQVVTIVLFCPVKMKVNTIIYYLFSVSN